MAAATRTSRNIGPDGAGPRVLVIEDNDDIRRSVRRSLMRGRICVLEASRGEEGLRTAWEQAPDLILCDVTMPGLSGFEVLEQLRQDPRTAATPVVLMTALDDRASVRKGMMLGADDYLTKPFSSQEVRDAVNARLARLDRISADFATKLAETRDALLRATHQDQETGLQNRAGFRSRLNATDAESALAVLIVELDRFERIRAALHASQPELMASTIREVAGRLVRAAGDADLVYRLDTSRFAVLLPGEERAAAASSVAEEILSSVQQPIGSETIEVRLTGSIGVARRPPSVSWPAKTLAGHAEVAAHHARETGGNHSVAYDPTNQDSAYSRMLLESSMHRALERDQFQLHYQPQVAAGSGRLSGVEALIRWNHPELGQITPFHFIPIAEESGLIVPIGRWVIEEACQQMRRWEGPLREMRVSVNLSALQLAEPNLAMMVLDLLREHGVPPGQLCVELTETMMITAGENAARSLRILREAGVQVALDDFGTGYSSLTNLRSFPVTEVKIDRSFVRRIPQDRDNCSIVSAVIEMAHQLGMTVIAEGAEDEDQLAFLRGQRCDEIQGFYYSRPLPAQELARWAADHTRQA